MAAKKRFEVQENETLVDCLNRMKLEGYMPIKRVEKPIFKEVIENGKTNYEPSGRKIVFEAVKTD